MVEFETFRNAPITEAVIDIRVALPDDFDVLALEHLAARLKSNFPGKQTRYRYIGTVEAHGDDSPKLSHGESQMLGYLFKNEKQDRAVQARFDGFAFSELGHYDSWEKFKNESRAIWSVYCDVMRPIKVTRVSTRYINKIELPLGFKDFNEYMKTHPEVSQNLPQGIVGFFYRLFIPDDTSPALAIVTSTMEKPDMDRQVLPLIFDIDAFLDVDVGIEGDCDEAWSALDNLRDYKNRIFFGSITEKAAELFR